MARPPARPRRGHAALRARDDDAPDVLARRSGALLGARSRAHRAPAARAKRTVRAIARAILGDERVARGRASLVDSRSRRRPAGSPLFAEELARLAAQGRDAAQRADDRGRDPGARSTRSTTRRATRRRSSSSSACRLGRRARGARRAERGRDAARARVAPRCSSSRRSRASRSTREWAFKHALMREVAYASLGEDALKELHARAGQWLAKMGEDDATVARHLELGGEPSRPRPYLEKAARRALAANALGDAVTLAEKSLAFAEDKPTQFARAQLLDEAWNRLDARAGERDTAVRAMEEAVYDEASEVRATRRARALRGRVRRRTRTRARGSRRCAATRRPRVSSTRRRAARRRSRRATRSPASSTRRPRSPSRSSSLAQRHGDPRRRGRRVADARGRSPGARRRRRGARSATERGARRERGRPEDARGDAHDQRGLRAHDDRREGRGARRDRGRHRARAGGRLARHRAPRPDEPPLLGRDVRRARPRSIALLAEPRSVADAAVGGQLGAARSRDARRPLLPRRRAPAKLRRRRLRGARAHAPPHGGARLPRDEDARRRPGRARASGPRPSVAAARPSARARSRARPRSSSSRARRACSTKAPIFLALHDACVDLGDLAEARDAIARGIPRLVTRVHGLSGTPYARDFLTQLPPNAGLLAAAEAYGLMPKELAAVLGGDRMSLPPPSPVTT